jgi:RNA polymerase sigma factor (sigma-70 family)
MINAPIQAFCDHMQSLFDVGTCAGLSDGQLLERFLAGRDEAGELAFEALVTRHGPMVMGVCRNVLDDPHDVHDAFQAVFLVLAQRAIAIRNRQSVGSWLHGVAVRVTARARVAGIRRQIRDRRTIGAAQAVAADAPGAHDASPIERHDRAEVVHQELSHLPEKYRAPVVLCYLEGLTHDEAAARLSWPVGTVRSRLARARDRLRTRLGRRGLSAQMALGPMARSIFGDAAFTASAPTFSSEVISKGLAASIARTVCQLPVGQSTAALTGPSASLRLAHGVYKTMLFKKLLVTACAVVPLATATLGVGLFLATRTQAHVQTEPAVVSGAPAPQATAKEAPQPDEVDRLARELLETARKRYEAQKAYYDEGRITIDRLIDASKALELAELRLATTEADGAAARRRHIDHVNELEQREKAEFAAGRATLADVLEARQRYLEAELDLKIGQRQAKETAALLRRLDELERKVEQLQKERARR